MRPRGGCGLVRWAHVHDRHEAFYLLSGDEVELWTGDDLGDKAIAHAGDYLYIPAGAPRVRACLCLSGLPISQPPG